MAKYASTWISPHKSKRLLLLLFVFSIFVIAILFLWSSLNYCYYRRHAGIASAMADRAVIPTSYSSFDKNRLGFMRSKFVLLVSHELSLSGGLLLLMELAFLLRNVGTEVAWMTYQKPAEDSEAIYIWNIRYWIGACRAFILHHIVQLAIRTSPGSSSSGQDAVNTVLKSDMIILNTAVTGKWLEAVLKEHITEVLPKILWWIHEMRGHYFKLDYVKHLPYVAGAMIDSHSTAEYWKSRTSERLGIAMPSTYVVHLGNSKELMEVAEDAVARRVLREHIRESLGLHNEDLLFAIINSVSRGKGQDLFLQSFYESLKLVHIKKLQVPAMHAVIVGSDMSGHTKLEIELRTFAVKQGIKDRVHFVNKTLTVAPFLAAIDVLVQNSQARGECFGRITIEAMAFQLPVLGTSAGGTTEIVINGSTGLLHPTGKEFIPILAQGVVKLATQVETRLTMGKKGF
ncbi:hypothetical protein HPP92_015499 [Vanilla planifolia]|uniref:Glycosyl transferase family 1 domain-containing protein n=1 Tax=Vanilla planifolia TaxID=51239 RepID=A0A835QGD6_VANPL|nr:hypothetical protein HPP92_015499 [Vanilla planifolia]